MVGQFLQRSAALQQVQAETRGCGHVVRLYLPPSPRSNNGKGGKPRGLSAVFDATITHCQIAPVRVAFLDPSWNFTQTLLRRREVNIVGSGTAFATGAECSTSPSIRRLNSDSFGNGGASVTIGPVEVGQQQNRARNRTAAAPSIHQRRREIGSWILERTVTGPLT